MRHGLILWAVSLTMAARAGEDFEIRIGDRTYSAREGEPVTVTTPRGEEVALTVRLPATRTFANAGLQFDYPSGMTMEETDPSLELRQVTVETVNSTLFMAMIFDESVSSSAAFDEFLDTVRGQARLMSGKKPEESATQREIGGKAVSGRKLVWRIGQLENTTEVYLIADESPNPVLLIFQADQEDRAEAEACFKVIADSLKLIPGTRSPPLEK